MKHNLLIISLLLFSLSASPQSVDRKLRNLEAFARLYGYVQYFHPSADVPKDWAVLAVYGSRKMLSVDNDTQLITELNHIFAPVAPSVQIYPTATAHRFDLKKITPEHAEDYSIVSWQHLGFAIPLYPSIYQSVKLSIPYPTRNRRSPDQLFKKRAKIGEYLKTPIVEGISCIVPYALYSKQGKTYPAASAFAKQELMQEMENALPRDSSGKLSITADFPEIRLADVMIAWNILKHSYPYWNDASLPAEKILSNALKKAIADRNPEDFLQTLQLMCADINDGHMFVDFTNPMENSNESTVPLILAEAEGKIVIKKINEEKITGIQAGDTVDSIEHQEVMSYLLSRERYLSGSPQWKKSKSLIMALNGQKNTVVSLSITGSNGQHTALFKRDATGVGYRNGSEDEPYTKDGWLQPGIYYLNLSRTSVTDKLITEQFCKAKAILFDLRGYPVDDNVFNILPHLIAKPLKKRKYFFIPQMIYPDLKKVDYQSNGSKTNPALPYVKAKIFFLTDATAQSASETVLLQVKGIPNVTIIGTPSSGTNGNININMISLPGKYRIGYTGMITKNADGSKHHLKGILPDVISTPTINGIKNGQDETLNLAVKIATAQKN